MTYKERIEEMNKENQDLISKIEKVEQEEKTSLYLYNTDSLKDKLKENSIKRDLLNELREETIEKIKELETDRENIIKRQIELLKLKEENSYAYSEEEFEMNNILEHMKKAVIYYLKAEWNISEEDILR